MLALTINAYGANVMPTDSYQFTIVADTTSPYVTGRIPDRMAVNVTPDTMITLHVKDDETGVDQTTIQLTVNGVVVNPIITGTPADYTLDYQPSQDFQNNNTVYITVEASDLAN